MRKKLICMILSVIMVSGLFSGCTLIEHNDKKDAQQVVAVVNPITDTRTVDGVEKTFKSDKKTIYKSDLVSFINQNAENMQQQNQNITQNQLVDESIKQLTIQQLLLIEADRLQFFGDIEWTQKEVNQVNENIYATIDSQINAIKKEISKDFNEPTPSDEKLETPKPTFPLTPEETNDLDFKYYKQENGSFVYEKNADGSDKLDEDGNRIHVIITWAPDESKYPAMYGDDDKKSLEGEAVRRFIQLLKDLVKDDFRLTAEDKSKFAEDDKKINDIINNSALGIAGVYPMLGSTHYVEYLIGKNARQSVQISLLQKYIMEGNDVKVTDAEVKSAYDSLLKEQTLSYNTDPKAYETDISGGTVNVLYNKTNTYFYVKHILLPFSAEQTERLKTVKAQAAEDGTDYKVIRDSQFVNETVVYPHVKGENDLTSPTTIQDVFEEISSEMLRVKSSPYEAERLFNEYIYKYNTDPGIFDKAQGYAVKRVLADGEKGAYMEEFEAVARKLINDKYSIGSVAPEYAVTDYGVHIMYLANTISAGSTNDLYAYQTPGKYKTYYQVFEDKIKTNKEQAVFKEWQENRITYYQNKEGIIVKYEKRYKSLYSK